MTRQQQPQQDMAAILATMLQAVQGNQALFNQILASIGQLQPPSSAENVWADWISRGKLDWVLSAARGLGLPFIIHPTPATALSLLDALVGSS